MLIKIRDYIKQEKLVSIKQLSRALGIGEEVLEPMLQLWEKKGLIIGYKGPISCKKSCGKCQDNNSNDFYVLC
jgi:DNA-binding IscR family transcriptional regulator